jgi:hypothetical protein
MTASLATRWLGQFHRALEDEAETSIELREASLQRQLKRWTAALTGVVVRSLEALGLSAAARQNRCQALPLPQQEYLGQDVMAFAPGPPTWRFPIAVAELENAPDDKRVAYSLWKTLCVRCQLRVVFCYRPELAAGAPLVSILATAVLGELPAAARAQLEGETLVVVGSRNEASTFPHGFFQAWKLNLNTGRFEWFTRA